MLDLNRYSFENLGRIQKVLKIVLDNLELQQINRLTGNRIPLKSFEKEGFSYEEIKILLYGIDDKHDIIRINNDDIKEKYEKIKIPGTSGNESVLKIIYKVSIEDLKNYLLITVKDLNKLKEIKKEIDGRTKIYAEEMIRQLKELNEKQKALDELGKQIYSRIQKDFSAPFQYLKYYEEISKKISEQLAPLKDALERFGKAQQTVKISLTPALQRLTPSLKQLEEQIKNFNELYKAPDHSLSEAIISPDLIRVRQGAEMISELREVRKLIEKSTTERTKPMPITIVGDVGIKKFGEKNALPKSKNNIKLPPNTIWEDIEIKFQNDFDIEIYVKGKFLEKRDNVEMEFFKSGTKDKKPDIQWYFLYSLSTVQHLKKEEATIRNMADMLSCHLGDNKKITDDACMQIKSKLSKKLQEIFNINTEPFYDYEERRFYQTKFKLKPVPDLRGDGEPYFTGTRYDDSKEYKKSGDDDTEDDLNSNY